MGEDVQWDPYGEIYRVKDLSLSRAIGDRFAKPVVSSEAEIDCLSVNDDEDEFFVSLTGSYPFELSIEERQKNLIIFVCFFKMNFTPCTDISIFWIILLSLTNHRTNIHT